MSHACRKGGLPLFVGVVARTNATLERAEKAMIAAISAADFLRLFFNKVFICEQSMIRISHSILGNLHIFRSYVLSFASS